MAGFETFDLGRIIATAEGIKGMRRAAETDKLRELYLNTQIQGAQQQQQIAGTEHQANVDQRTARQRFLEADAIMNSQDPLRAAREFAPELVQQIEAKNGPGSFDQLPPDTIKQLAGMARERAASIAGISLRGTPEQQFAATAAADQAKTQHGYRLSEIAETGRQGRLTAAQRPTKQWRMMREEELKGYNLPPGTAAQIDDSTGEVEVLSKRDNTNSLSQKDATTAKMKLNTVSIARQQLNRIRDEFEGRKNEKTGTRSGGIKGTMSAGPGWTGQGYTPSEAGAKFDAAVDQMRSTLTALTRVPGVGAMSDYETKLDQSKFPSRKNYESVTQQQIDDLDNMLNAIETGYRDLLSSGSQNQAPQGPPPNDTAAPTATGPNGQKLILRNGQWVPLGG